jgi:non-ribosomal peptide synthetase component F
LVITTSSKIQEFQKSIECAADFKVLKEEYQLLPNSKPSSANLSTKDIAYMIFTSGTTGTPKGVMISHLAVVNSVLAYAKVVNNDSNSRVLQFNNIGFDVSVADIFATLTRGSTIVIASEDRLLTNLEDVLISGRISHCDLTPTVAQFLDPKKLPNLKVLTMGGEMLSRNVVDRWIEAGTCCIINGYGESQFIQVDF